MHPKALEWYWIKKSLLDLLCRNENPPIVFALRTSIGYHEASWLLSQALHTLLFWLIVYLVASKVFPRWKAILPLVYGAIFFHIFIDWPTHIGRVRHYLWPFTFWQSGFISHANPWLLRIEIGISVVWLLTVLHWLVTRMRDRKKSS